MICYLKINNSELNRSFSIVVSDNKIRLKTWFKPPVQLDKQNDYEIALINLETYDSYPNLDKSNIWFTNLPYLDPLWFDITIPEGSYHVENINEFVQRKMRENEEYDKANDKNYLLKYLLIPSH